LNKNMNLSEDFEALRACSLVVLPPQDPTLSP
jgi:hypothetical protein